MSELLLFALVVAIVFACLAFVEVVLEMGRPR